MRILRVVWVFLANGTVVYFFYSGASQVALLNHLLEQDAKNKQLWLYFGLRISIPVLGAILEALGSRAAKFVNIGFFLLIGALFTSTGLLNWSVFEGHLYLFFGLCALTIALVSFFLYRRPKIAVSSPVA